MNKLISFDSIDEIPGILVVSDKKHIFQDELEKELKEACRKSEEDFKRYYKLIENDPKLKNRILF